MLADYNFYHGTYKGIVFSDATSYEYYGERASDELAPYSNMAVFTTDETAATQLKKCACRIADIMFSAMNGGKQGKAVQSENIVGYYSATYAVKTDAQVRSEVSAAIKTYLGAYILGARRVIW